LVTARDPTGAEPVLFAPLTVRDSGHRCETSAVRAGPSGVMTRRERLHD
jgi:hypothetical protein